MKLTKNVLKVGVSLSVLFVGSLFWFFSQGNKGATKETVNDKNDSAAHLENPSVKNELAVNPSKCIGCGKCAHLAPDNFVMRSAPRRAEVVSQENLENASVKRTIEVCPTSAITI